MIVFQIKMIRSVIKACLGSFSIYYVSVNTHMHYHLLTSPESDVPHPVWNSSEEWKICARKYQPLIMAAEDLIRGSLTQSKFNTFFSQKMHFNSQFVSLTGADVGKFFSSFLHRKIEVEPISEYYTNCGFCLLLKLDPSYKKWARPIYDKCLVFVSLAEDSKGQSKISTVTYQINQKHILTGKHKKNWIMGPQHDFVKAVNSFFISSVLKLIPSKV